jgi:hypothetical protein
MSPGSGYHPGSCPTAPGGPPGHVDAGDGNGSAEASFTGRLLAGRRHTMTPSVASQTPS